MKHVFVINPAAGKGNKLPSLLSAITYACQELHAEYEIYHTTTVGDATRFVTETCKNADGAPLRIYACGGDGTVNEVVSGVVGFSNVQVAIVPVGTGNDFVKVFSDVDYFKDIKRQILGKPAKMDLIKFNERYCLNVLNIGFDCEVVQKVTRIKRNALVPSKLAYAFGVAGTFSKKIGTPFKITIDDEPPIEREFSLCAMANGTYYGGGYKVAPYSMINDGMIDLCLIDRVSHLTFIKLIPSYKAGKHVAEDGSTISSFIQYRKCRKVTIEAETPIGFCADGEIFPYQRVTVEVMPSAVSIVIPKGCRPLTMSTKPAQEKEPVPV